MTDTVKLSELPSGQTIITDSGKIVAAGVTTATTVAATLIETADKTIAGSLSLEPTADSVTVKAGVYGEAKWNSTFEMTDNGHFLGVLGEVNNINTGTVAGAYGVEGRVDCLVGDITVAAGVIATFGTNAANAGSISVGIGFYMPNQADSGHITSKYAFYNAWVDASVKTDGKVEIGKDIDFDATVTATVGAVTINKSAGRVIMALGTSQVVVTNNLVTANSVITLTGSGGVDGGAFLFDATAGSGTFTINASGNALANKAINFLVVN